MNIFEQDCVKCKNFMEILNWYRNLYYKEPEGTEKYIMAMAINDLFMKAKELDILDELNN